MSTNLEQFPRTSQLFQGAILGTIAHALWIAKYPDFANEQSWDGPNYSVQNSQDVRGTITFLGSRVVGVFRDESSPRNPFSAEEEYDLSRFLVGMTPDLLDLATNEALQYVLEDYKGNIVPIITTAFWSDGEFLTSAEPWHEVVENGAKILQTQLIDTKAAITKWQSDYEISASQATLMRTLFDRKIKLPDTQITLSSGERDLLVANNAEGIEESRQLLGAIGIILP